MFGKAQGAGLDFAFPDVCKTPVGAVPVPIPYPNLALPPMGVPAAYIVLFMCMPAHFLLTTIVMTNGDNAGVAMGLVAPSVMGPSRNVTAAFTVLVMGIPATRLTSITITNTFNAVGATVVPSQLKVLILAA
jgi:hypothetical protein